MDTRHHCTCASQIPILAIGLFPNDSFSLYVTSFHYISATTSICVCSSTTHPFCTIAHSLCTSAPPTTHRLCTSALLATLPLYVCSLNYSSMFICFLATHALCSSGHQLLILYARLLSRISILFVRLVL